MNGGIDVDDEEVDWVLAEADVLGDGAVTKPEMVMASRRCRGNEYVKVFPIGNSQLGIPNWEFPVGNSQLGIPSWEFPIGNWS